VEADFMMWRRFFVVTRQSLGIMIIIMLLGSVTLPSKSAEAAVEFAVPGFVSEPVTFIQSTPPVLLNNLVAFAWSPTGDKLFLAHKFGRITTAIKNGNGSYQIMNQSFANINFQTNVASDRGLLSIAVDPAWPTRPYLYALFVYDPPEIQAAAPGRGGPDGSGARVSRIIRMQANSALNYNRALMQSMPPAQNTFTPQEVVILGTNSTFENIGDPLSAFSPTMPPSCENAGNYVVDCLPADSPTHAIGKLQFDTDGNLWVSNGDGAEFNFTDPKALRSLDLDSLAGKMMRIDPDTGLGLPDNPYYDGNPASNRSRVVSYGLRNPFRYTLHPTTNEPFIGDVGWNVWEEFNRGVGKNFGWPCYEGNNVDNLRQPAYETNSATSATCAALYNNASSVTRAIYSYQQINSNGAALAGDFYTGTNYPGIYKDALFVFDYALNRIQYLKFSGANGETVTINDFATNASPDFPDGGAVVQLSRGPATDTDLYYIILDDTDSELRRIRYTGANTPPDVIMTATPSVGSTPLTVSFASSGSSDADGDALVSFEWDFGDGSPIFSGPSAGHTYTTNDDFIAKLTVTDARGGVTTVQKRISAGNDPPSVQITAPMSGTTYRVISDTIQFAASISDPNETLTASQINWSATLHHDTHTHPDTPITVNLNNLGGHITPEDHGDATWVELCVTATDSRQVRATDCIDLRPKKVAYTFASDPNGFNIIYEGIARTTPFTVQANENATQQIIVSPTQGNYVFKDWFDGLSPLSQLTTYGLRVGSFPQTIVARYVVPSPPQQRIYLPSIQKP
jgi:PKD repeat protein